jgi:hypothetical protein
MPLGDFGTASCAPRLGTQYDPLDVYPCGHEPPGPGGFGSGNGSAMAAVAMTTTAAITASDFICAPFVWMEWSGQPP